MKFLIMSDPHIGKNLTAHTTKKSRTIFKQNLLASALAVTTQVPDKKLGIEISPQDFDACICLGDIVDRYDNDAQTVMQAHQLMQNVDLLLSGNHDVHNDASAVGTIDILQEIHPDNIIRAKFDENRVEVEDTGDELVVSIPYLSSKERFESALVSAMDKAAGEARPCLLLLHCNYDSGYAEKDTELNLSSKTALNLLQHFDYIFIGHDHKFKTDHGGRVIVMGNTYPTGFGDVSSKYHALYDNGKVTFHKHWDHEKHSIKVDVEQLLNPEYDPSGRQFVEITGTVAPDQLFNLAKAIKREWTLGEDTVAVRSNVTIAVGNADPSQDLQTPQKPKLTEVVEQELKEQPELLKLWKEITSD